MTERTRDAGGTASHLRPAERFIEPDGNRMAAHVLVSRR
jgi:hypothetical protein